MATRSPRSTPRLGEPRRHAQLSKLHDDNFVAASVDRLVTGVAGAYERLGGRLEVHHPDCAHDFPPDLQDAAIRFADQALREDAES